MCGCGKKKCCSTTTTLDILKNSVSQRSCCSPKQAQITVWNFIPALLEPGTGGGSFESLVPYSVVDPKTLRGFFPPNTPGVTNLKQIKVQQAGVYIYDFIVIASASDNNAHAGFILKINGQMQDGTSFVASRVQCADCPGSASIRGFGLLNLKVGDIIELLNVSGSGQSSASLPTLPTIPQGVDEIGTPNTTFRMVKVC